MGKKLNHYLLDRYGGTGSHLCVLYRKEPENTVNLHTHDFDELVLVKSGNGKHVTGSGEYAITRGNVFLVRRGSHHGYRNMEEMYIANILYRPEELAMPLAEVENMPGYQAFFATAPRLTDDFRFHNTLRLPPDAMEEAENLVEAMAVEQKRKADGYRFAMVALLMRLVLLVSRAAGAPVARNAGEDVLRINRLIRFLDERYDTGLSIEDIAAYANMTVRSLERFFRKATGQPPMRYLLDLRLNKAAERLRDTADPVTDIALRHGFTDSGYFCRMFKQKFTCPPRAYRTRFTAKKC